MLRTLPLLFWPIRRLTEDWLAREAARQERSFRIVLMAFIPFTPFTTKAFPKWALVIIYKGSFPFANISYEFIEHILAEK